MEKKLNEGQGPVLCNYSSSARPITEQTNIRKTLKVTDEPALHLSVVQQATPQSSSPLSSHAFLVAVQSSLVVHIIVTEWISKALACDLWQVPSEQVFTYLASSASSFDFEQTVSSSDCLPYSMQL